MRNSIPPLTFEDKIRAATKAQLPLPSPAFQSRLEQQLFSQPTTSSKWYERFTMISIHPIRKIALAIFVLAMILAIIAGPQNVLAAIRNLLRYIPRVGMVEPNHTALVLAAPLQYEQDGVIYTIEAFYADENETILTYRAENLPAEENQALMQDHPSHLNGASVVHLILPSGQHIRAQHSHITSTGFDRSVWAEQLRFSALPAGVEQLRILFVQIPSMAKGIAPENVQLEINLRPAEEGDIFPVFEPQLVPVEDEKPAMAGETQTALLDLLKINIQAVSIIEGDLLLQISLNMNEYPDYQADLITQSVYLEDAAGNRLPLAYDQTENDPMMNPGQHVFKVPDFDLENTLGPLRLVVGEIELYVPHQSVFTFEKPEDLAYGACKQVYIEFSVIDGSIIHLDEVCLQQNDEVENFPEYSVNFSQHTPYTDSLRHFLLWDSACEGIKPMHSEYCGGGAGGTGGELGENIAEYNLQYWAEPQFPIVVAAHYSIVVSQNWDIHFELPEDIVSSPAQPQDNQSVEATAIPYDAGTPVSEHEDELAQLRTMLTDYGNQFLTTGWVHLSVTQTNSHAPEYTTRYETWFNYDDQHNLIARYGQGYDHKGTLLFQNYYADGIGVSVPENDNERMPAYRVNFYDDIVPLSFFSVVKQFEQKIAEEDYSLVIENGQYKEQDVVMFKLISPPLVPYRCENNGECRVINTAYLDAATGRLIAEDTYQVFPEGDPTVSYSATWEINILEALPDPPLEMLNAMKNRAEDIISKEGIMEPRDNGGGGGG